MRGATHERPEYVGDDNTMEDEETTDHSSFGLLILLYIIYILLFCCSIVFCNTVSNTVYCNILYTCVAIPSSRQ